MSTKPKYPAQYNIGDVITITGKPKTKNTQGGLIEVDIGIVDCTIESMIWTKPQGLADEGSWSYGASINDPKAIEEVRKQAVVDTDPEEFRIFGEEFVQRARRAKEEFDPKLLVLQDETHAYPKPSGPTDYTAPTMW